MLYWLVDLSDKLSVLNVFRYITFRTGGAVTGPGAAPPFAQLPAGRGCFAMPISIRGEAVAVLYADQGAGLGAVSVDERVAPAAVERAQGADRGQVRRARLTDQRKVVDRHTGGEHHPPGGVVA